MKIETKQTYDERFPILDGVRIKNGDKINLLLAFEKKVSVEVRIETFTTVHHCQGADERDVREYAFASLEIEGGSLNIALEGMDAEWDGEPPRRKLSEWRTNASSEARGLTIEDIGKKISKSWTEATKAYYSKAVPSAESPDSHPVCDP